MSFLFIFFNNVEELPQIGFPEKLHEKLLEEFLYLLIERFSIKLVGEGIIGQATEVICRIIRR